MIAESTRAATAEEYTELREVAGMGVAPVATARIGLARTLHGVWLREEGGALVAMGRLIGDGGCFVQVTDIAVRPDLQRRGLGTQVMTGLMTWARANLPTGCYVSLIADPGAEHLYAKFGFTSRHGMSITI